MPTVLLGHSPMEKVEQRFTLKRNMANQLYKPPANQEAGEIKVDRILYYAREFSQPDNQTCGEMICIGTHARRWQV